MVENLQLILNENDIKEILAEKYEKEIYDVELKYTEEPFYGNGMITAIINCMKKGEIID